MDAGAYHLMLLQTAGNAKKTPAAALRNSASTQWLPTQRLQRGYHWTRTGSVAVAAASTVCDPESRALLAASIVVQLVDFISLLQLMQPTCSWQGSLQ